MLKHSQLYPKKRKKKSKSKSIPIMCYLFPIKTSAPCSSSSLVLVQGCIFSYFLQNMWDFKVGSNFLDHVEHSEMGKLNRERKSDEERWTEIARWEMVITGYATSCRTRFQLWYFLSSSSHFTSGSFACDAAHTKLRCLPMVTCRVKIFL